MATGFGSIELECKVNSTKRILALRDVWLVPDSGFNLISEGQLEEQGFQPSRQPEGKMPWKEYCHLQLDIHMTSPRGCPLPLTCRCRNAWKGLDLTGFHQVLVAR